MDIIKIYADALARKHVILDREERDELLTRVKTDPEARKRVVESVLPLVLKLAGKFSRTPSGKLFELSDLIQEGAIAAMYAVDSFKIGAGSNIVTWTNLAVLCRYQNLAKSATRDKRSTSLVPIHLPKHDEDELALGDTIGSEEPTPEEQFQGEELRHRVNQRLQAIPFTPVEKHFLQARIMSDDPVSLARMAVTHGKSEETMRKGEIKFLCHLRSLFEELRRAA